MIGRGGEFSGVERIGALQAVAAATASGDDFEPIPSGATDPFANTLEVAFADVDRQRSVLVLGTVTFRDASSEAVPEIRAEMSIDGGAYAAIEESNASQPEVDGAGNIALSCVSPPLTEAAGVLRVRLAWRATSSGSTEEFKIDPSKGANAQIIAAVVQGTPRP